MHAKGESSYQISRELNLKRSTIRDFLKKFKLTGDTTTHHSDGRPRKTSVQDDRAIVRESKRDRRQPLAEIQVNVLPNVSIRTIKRRLLEHEIKKWRAANRPKIDAIIARKRLEWALRYKDWTWEDWVRVVWSDECSVEKGADPRQVWVFRTPYEKWHKDCINPSQHSGRVSVMIWGCFAGGIKGPIVVVVGRIDSKRYLKEVCEEVLLDFMDGVEEHIESEPIFMQDNAPVHKAKRVMKWMKEQGVEVMEWPPYSPDLNPIEHIWVHLKAKVHEMFPDLKFAKNTGEPFKRYLQECVEKAWWALDERIFENLAKTMPRRVEAVIRSKGWYTKY